MWTQVSQARCCRYNIYTLSTQLVLALASLAAGARCQVNQEIYSEQDLLAIDSEARPVAVLPPPGLEAASASVLSSLPPGEHHQDLENLFNSFFIVSIYQIPTKYLCCFPLCFCGELTVVTRR